MLNQNEKNIFQPFDREAEVEISSRNLPHWYQPGAAIFVTFRTADSMPKEVLLRWQRELEHWLQTQQLPAELAELMIHRPHTDREHLLNQLGSAERQELKRLCDRLFHQSLDECHGACLLRREDMAQLVSDAILFAAGEKYDLESFVVMPNHVHAIVQFRAGACLDVVSQSWMRYSAREINKLTGGSGSFWQSEPFDHLIRSTEQFEYLRRYIRDNPKKAHLKRGEYLYWKG